MLETISNVANAQLTIHVRGKYQGVRVAIVSSVITSSDMAKGAYEGLSIQLGLADGLTYLAQGSICRICSKNDHTGRRMDFDVKLGKENLA